MNKITAENISSNEFFYGHKACAGCGGSLAVRMALKILGERTFTVLPAGCMSAVGFNFPQLCFGSNAIISTFAGTGSMLTGIEAGAKALGIKNYKTVGFAGDGGTADIGIQALSGAIDRGDNIIYICYDNEAYMNTGVQKSGLTPYGAKTTTTPAGERIRGNIKLKKTCSKLLPLTALIMRRLRASAIYRISLTKSRKPLKLREHHISILSPHARQGGGVQPMK